MKRKIISLIVLCAGLFEGHAQVTMPASCEAGMPRALSGRDGRILTLKESAANAIADSPDFGQGDKLKAYWQVWSDRDDNPVYASSTGSRVAGYLGFNEKVTIAKIENGRALVLSGAFNKGDYPKIPVNAKSLGWVPMSKLLLWDTCPTDEYGIYNKALIALNLNAAGLKNATEVVGKLFGNPENTSRYTSLTTDKKFYFIMKRERNMVLLATQYTVSSGFSSQVLFGWVNEGSYVPWNQRSCLEPTWEREDVHYFYANGIKPHVYPSATSNAPVVQGWDFTYEEELNREGKLARLPGEELRFPLLDVPSVNRYHFSSFGTAEGGVSGDGGSVGLSSSSIGLTQEALEKLSRINICLVIDGTESMRGYYSAVQEAILKGCSVFNDNFKVKVGALIYRDQEDVLDGVSYETETFAFTSPNNPKLTAFIRSGGDGRYGIRSAPSDRTAEESLYYGMYKALDLFKGHESESNIMLVVGDCGNNDETKDSRVSQKALLDRLFERNVQVMAFQVEKKSTPSAYGKFQNQIATIMKTNLERKYGRLDERGVTHPSKVVLEPVPGGYFLENDAKSNIYIGAIRFPEINRRLSPEDLTSSMISSIDNLSGAIQHQLDILVQGTGGGGWNPSDDHSGFTYSDAFIEEMTGQKPVKGVTMSFRGYTPRADRNHEFYKTIIFISSDELKDLILKLQPVADQARKRASDRQPYIKALQALIRQFVPDITPQQMADMSQQEIMILAAGLNAASASVKGYSITEIADPHRVNAAAYQSMLDRFSSQFNRLKRIQSADYEYVLNFNGAKYYWIPIEDLP